MKRRNHKNCAIRHPQWRQLRFYWISRSVTTGGSRLLNVLLFAFFLSLSAFGQSQFKTEQITVGAVNHRAPGINNSGEILWMAETSGANQVVSSVRGQLTTPIGSYGGAEYPSVADDGSYVCFRPFGIFGDIVRYPGGGVYESSTRNVATGARRNPVKQSGISSNGKVIWGREFYQFGSLSTRRFFLDGTEVSLPSSLVNWQNPSVNRNGDFVYDNGGSVYIRYNGISTPQFVASGTQPGLNDRGDIVYVSGSQVKLLRHDGQLLTLGPGADPAINADGIVVFEAQVGGYYQIFRARPAMLTLHRLEASGLVFSSSDDVDFPLDVKPDPIVLADQHRVGAGVITDYGLIADGVTPLLIKLSLVETPTQPTSFALDLSVKSGGAIVSGNLNQKLRVLGPSGFAAGTTLIPTSDTGYAYIGGIRAEDVSINSGSTDLTVELTVKGPSLDLTNTFKIRKPPVVLVHGYFADSGTWSSAFLSLRPAGFAVPIEYGVTVANGTQQNTFGALQDLVYVLDARLREFENTTTDLRKAWAFTRYDVVAHSQGGILTRMLCAEGGVPHALQLFRRPGNFYRGRFHRVITIDSPHNGSVIPYYLGALGPTPRAFIPAVLRLVGILQNKFNPFDSQITDLNALGIDRTAKFHLIRTTIAAGMPPSGAPLTPGCPLSYYAAGLCSPFRGPALLPRGSDGVVDFDSTGAGVGTPNTVITGQDIAHSGPEWVFGVAPENTATRATMVADMVRQLLDGPAANFARFVNPMNLDPHRKKQIDDLAAEVTYSDLISLITPSPGPAAGLPSTPSSSSTFEFLLQPLPSEPLNGDVGWSLEVFGTNGVATDGAFLLVDSGDSRHVTVSVDDATKGTVVLYANFTSSNGTLVFATPIVVVEKPVGTSVVAIEVRPTTVALATGDPIDLTIWGVYENGLRGQLFIPFDSPAAFASSDSTVVAIESNNVVRLLSPGTATLSVSFGGFTNQTVVTVLGHILEPSLVASGVSSNGQFVATIIGSANRQHVVEVSSNLTSWMALSTNVLDTNGRFQFIDASGTNLPSRFYRATLTP